MITCSCGNIQCFVCSKNVDGHGHFGYDNEDCPLFDNTRVRQRRAVATAQEEAVQERLKMDVALTEDDLLIDPNLRILDEEQLDDNTEDEADLHFVWPDIHLPPLDWLARWRVENERRERELREQQEREEREREERERAEAAEQARREVEQARREEAERILLEKSQRKVNRDRRRITRATQAQDQRRQSKIGWARVSGNQKRAWHR